MSNVSVTVCSDEGLSTRVSWGRMSYQPSGHVCKVAPGPAKLSPTQTLLAVLPVFLTRTSAVACVRLANTPVGGRNSTIRAAGCTASRVASHGHESVFVLVVLVMIGLNCQHPCITTFFECPGYPWDINEPGPYRHRGEEEPLLR